MPDTDSPAPASTFYHLVGAIVALNTALRGSAQRGAAHA